MLSPAWGVYIPGRRTRSAVLRLSMLCAALVLPQAARAQSPVVLNVPDTQVIDTMIRNGSFATKNQDGAVLLTRSSTVPEWERRTILSFNTSSIPASTKITSAELTLTVKSGLGTSGATRPVAVRRLVSTFVERQATWRDRQTGTAWPTAGGDLGETITSTNVTNKAGAKVTFNVTALVQRAINGEFSRQARMVLIDTGGGGDAKTSYREYHSSEATTANRPQLTVRFGTTSGGTTVDVPAGGNLQAAIDSAQPGTTIRLASGATYVGNFRLPAKSSTSTAYITITTGGVSLPAADKRIDPSYKTSLATLKSSNGAAVLRAVTGAKNYKVVGVAFAPNVNGDGNIIELGTDSQTVLSTIPNNIVLDRILMWGDPTVGQRRGIAVQATNVSIINSDIRDIKRKGDESQAICGWNTPGPVTIKNNYISAAAENIMFGGAHITIANMVPSDIVIEGNYLTKNKAWRGTAWTVKNLLELKNARRVRIRGNTMEYVWANGQAGHAIVLTPRNSSKQTPWATVEDVEISANIIRHVGGVLNISGYDDTARSGQLKRLLVKDNLAYDVHAGTWGGPGTFAQIGNEPRDITLDHNTILHTGNIITFYSGTIIGPSGTKVKGGPIYGFKYTNNLAKHNTYGIFGSGKSVGNGSLTYYTPGAVVRRNVFATDKSVTSLYPSDNLYTTVAAFYAGFVNADGRDYHLVSSSPYIGRGLDGKDIGADIP